MMFIHFFLVYFQWYPHSEFLSAGSNRCYLCLSQLKSPCWLSLTNALQRRKVMFHFWIYGVAQGVFANSRFLCLSRLSVLFAGRKRAMEKFCSQNIYTPSIFECAPTGALCWLTGVFSNTLNEQKYHSYMLRDTLWQSYLEKNCPY